MGLRSIQIVEKSVGLNRTPIRRNKRMVSELLIQASTVEPRRILVNRPYEIQLVVVEFKDEVAFIVAPVPIRSIFINHIHSEVSFKKRISEWLLWVTSSLSTFYQSSGWFRPEAAGAPLVEIGTILIQAIEPRMR